MAKARTKKTSKKTTKTKTTKKTAAKKPAKKTASKKKSSKVASPRKKTTTKKRTTTAGQDTFTLKNLFKTLDFLRVEVAEIKELLTGKPTFTPSVTDSTNTDQMGLFDTPSNGGTTLTKEEIAQALQEVMATAGQDAVKTILAKFKAKRVSDIKEADYNDVWAECQETAQVAEHETAQEVKDEANANEAMSLF